MTIKLHHHRAGAPLDRLSVRCLSSYLLFSLNYFDLGKQAAARARVETSLVRRVVPFRESDSEEFVRLKRRGPGTGRSHFLLAIALLVISAAAALFVGTYPGTTDPIANDSSPRQVRASSFLASAPGAGEVLNAFGRLPLIFESNQGQTDPRVRFLAHGHGYGLYLTADQAVLTLRKSAAQTTVLRMKLARASADSLISGADELPGKSNYLIGNDPSRWYRNVPQFARVRYHNVYPGIDLLYYGKQGRLEYDFEVAPGSDPTQIALKFSGLRDEAVQDLRLDPNGDLILPIANNGDVHLQAPRVYQRFGLEQRVVTGGFALRGHGEVGFDLGDYDRTRALIIDPVLTYSTYLGGSGEESCSAILNPTGGAGSIVTPGCPAIAVDSGNNAYIAGSSTSTDFPNPTGKSPTLVGVANVFVAKFNNTGSALTFSTFIGGNGTDTPAGVAVDSGFNVVIAGNTTSTNFPANLGFQNAPLAGSGPSHVFVTKLDPTGSVLLYSTYLSGNGTDTATGVALDPSGNGYVTGFTTSTNQPSGTSAFPATLGAFQTVSKASSQFFLSVLNFRLTGFSSLIYSTYIGGSTLPSGGTATIGGGVAVDTNYNAYVTGGTSFTDMPVLNAFQGTVEGGIDVWVGKFNFPQNSSQPPTLSYLTYLGGTGNDIGYAIAVDSGSDAYITGSTTSTDFNFTSTTGITGFQPANAGGTDAFLAKLGTPCVTTTTGCTTQDEVVPFNYFSYLGGSGTDIGLGIAVDSAQGARITGYTNSTNFPVINNPVQSVSGGGIDAFVARIDTLATTSTAPGHYSTYLGGGGTDIGTSIAVDTQGASYVTGETSSGASSPFPTLNAFQGSLNGPSDAFVSKLSPLVNLALTVAASPSPVGIGNQVAFDYTITNTGDFISGVSFTDTLPATGATFVSAVPSTGSCATAMGGIVTCSLGALSASGTTGGGTATVTINVTATAGGSVGNSAEVTVPGSTFPGVTAGGSAVVNDFALTVSPASATVPAGVPASFTAVVTPTGAFPDSVSISCSSGLPTGATCTIPNNPISNLNTGAQSRDVVITTTERITTTTHLWHQGGPIYVAWLPVSGLALLGAGIGSKMSRRRRLLIGLLLGGFFSMILFQAGCSSTSSTTTTTGTPAGTYIVTISAISGSATRTTTVTLVVQ
jgi:hypothetical protein